jgi:hypothetical protein
MEFKKCTKCKIEKNINSFCKKKASKDGLNSWCVNCAVKYNRERKDYFNALDILRNEKTHYRNNYNKEYYKDEVNLKRKRKQDRDKYKNDINNRLSRIIKSVICRLFKGQKQGRKLEILLGYNIEDLRKNIAFKFTPKMTWENHGEWEIDHIKPVSSFKATNLDHEDFKKCWDLNNLQPLWKTTRVIEGIKYIGNRNKSSKIL